MGSFVGGLVGSNLGKLLPPEAVSHEPTNPPTHSRSKVAPTHPAILARFGRSIIYVGVADKDVVRETGDVGHDQYPVIESPGTSTWESSLATLS